MLRLLIALTTAVAFTPLHPHALDPAPGGKGFGELDPSKVASPSRCRCPSASRWYTCNRCETRNAISVSRVAWNEGVVLGSAWDVMPDTCSRTTRG